MFRDRWQLCVKYFPDFYDQVLTTRHFILHEVHIEVYILMVKFVGNFPLNQFTQFFKIDHETRFGIRMALYRHDQVEIMPMPMIVRAGPENFNVLLLRPSWIIKLVRCVEMFFSGDVKHANGQI